MTIDPRAALDRLTAALEAHFTAVVNKQDAEDVAVDDAYYVLADAFEIYDEAIGQVYSEVLPFYLAEDDEEDEEDGDFTDFDDDLTLS